MGISGWLTVLFTGLKLTNFIDWSWWMVTSPLWGGFIFYIVLSFTIAALESK